MVLNYKKTDAMLDITDRKLHHVAPHLHGVLEMVYVTEGTLEIGCKRQVLFHIFWQLIFHKKRQLIFHTYLVFVTHGVIRGLFVN